MRISVIERDIGVHESKVVAELVVSLGRRHGHQVERIASLADGDAANAYLLCGQDVAGLSVELSDTAIRASERLPRTILVGASPDFQPGFPAVDPGTVVNLMETYRLGGCFGPKALTSWQEAPSWFAGPKALMPDLGSNPVKMFQSPNYALWFSARGASMEDFLVKYVALLDVRISEK